MRRNHLNLSSKIFTLFFLSLFLLTSCGGDSTSSIDSGTLVAKNHGVAQKGPFAIGSQVDIEKLDSVGIATGEKITTTVSEKNGKFSYQLPDDWGNEARVQFQVEGFALDETNGSLSLHETNLLSIGSTSQKQASINVLTHLITLRAKVLLAKGNDLNTSLEQSEQELAKIFGINNISELDYSSLANHLLEDNASLLLLSGALMEVADQYNANVQVIIDQMAGDFANDGLIDTLGDDWLKRLQATIRDNPVSHVEQYSQTLKDILGIETVLGRALPEVINIASRPVSVLPREIFAEPNETIILDGSESHDNSEKGLINFTWFRVDQQSQFVIPFSDRFAESPSITTPNVEPAEFLFALVITDEDKLTDTSVIKVIVRTPEPINTPPAANDQSFVIEEDTPLTFILDAEDADNDPLSYSLSTPLLLPSSIINGEPPSLTYTPDLNFNGSSSFTYTVNDGQETSNVATVNIEILSVNDKPIADSQSLATNEEQIITSITLTGSDVDVGDTLTFSIEDLPEHGMLSGTSPNHSYTPDDDYNGTDSFSFVVNDGMLDSDEAIINITINPVNDAPTAIKDSYVVDEDGSVILDPLVDDSDPDVGDILVVSKINGVNLTNGIAQVISVSDGVVNITSLGVISFTPDTNFFGPVSFSYEISDGNGGTATADQLITVISINDNPIAVDDNYTVDEDDSVILNPLLGDSDPENDTLSISKINGTTLTNGIDQSILVPDGIVNISASGEISFVPTADFNGSVEFLYEISDGNGGADIATEAITVTSINDAPSAIDDHFTEDEDTTVSGNVISNIADDTDPENDILTVTEAKIDTDGDLTLETISLVTGHQLTDMAGGAIGTIGISANGDFTFLPAPNFNGQMPQLTYTISDGNGGIDSATLDITITPVNDAPSARSFVLTFNQGESVSFGSNSTQLGGTDPENDPLTVIGVSNPGPVINPSSLSFFDSSIFGRVYTYNPPTIFCGTDTLTYKVKEIFTTPPLESLPATVTFNVICNVAPKFAYIKSQSPAPVNGEDFGESFAGDHFGTVVAVSADGTTLAVGAPSDFMNPDRVHIYILVTNGWEYQSTILHPVPSSRISFGSAIALSNDGEKLVVGAITEDGGSSTVTNFDFSGRSVNAAMDPPDILNSGAAFLYRWSQSVGDWSLKSYFKASNANQNDAFGNSVSISGDGTTIAIGASSEDSADSTEANNGANSAGAVYVFKEDGFENWNQEAYIKASDVSAGDKFGRSVSLDGSGGSLIVGADGHNVASPSSSGAVYYYTRAGTLWTEKEILKQPTPTLFGKFGSNIDLSEDGQTCIISATGEDTGKGTTYIYALNSGAWSQEDRLTPPEAERTNVDLFGSSVSITADGNKVLIGAIGEDGNGLALDSGEFANPLNGGANNSGAAYTFVRSGVNWSQEHYLKASNANAFDGFGSSVAISSTGNVIIVGAPSEKSCNPGVNNGQSSNGCLVAGAVYANPKKRIIQID